VYHILKDFVQFQGIIYAFNSFVSYDNVSKYIYLLYILKLLLKLLLSANKILASLKSLNVSALVRPKGCLHAINLFLIIY